MSAVYPKAKEKFLRGEINMLTDTIMAALIDTGVYTYSATHEFFPSIEAAVIGTPVALSGKDVTDGVFDAANSTFASVPGPTSIEAVAIYKSTGTPANDPLIAFIDQSSDGSLPVTSNGGNIDVQWSDLADKIFRL